MYRQRYRFLTSALVAAAALAAALLAPARPATAGEALFSRETADLQAEARAARAEGRKLAVAFTLPDCPGCREMERSVFRDPAVASRFARQFRSVQVDLAHSEAIASPDGQRLPATEFARRLGAFATPSFAFFDGSGAFLYRSTGTLEAADFTRLGRYVARAGYEERPFVPSAKAAPRLQAEPPAAGLPRRPEFRLQDGSGRERRLADFRGRAVALAVGYSQCPDVCPTTLAELQAAVESLPASRRGRVQVLFATLDPERDGAALLQEYVAAFAPRGGRPILGLRGDARATAAFVRELQLVAERQPSGSLGYTLDHTAGVFLFDKNGVLRGFSPYGQAVAALAADLGLLSSETPPPGSGNVQVAASRPDPQGNPHHVQQ